MSVRFTIVAGPFLGAPLIFFLIDCGEMGIDISKSGYGFVQFCLQFNHFLLCLSKHRSNLLCAFENWICYHCERSCFVSGRTRAAFSQRQMINITKVRPHYIVYPVLPGTTGFSRLCGKNEYASLPALGAGEHLVSSFGVALSYLMKTDSVLNGEAPPIGLHAGLPCPTLFLLHLNCLISLDISAHLPTQGSTRLLPAPWLRNSQEAS